MSALNNEHEFEDAVATASGDAVQKITAIEAAPDMVLFHYGEWLTVKYVNRLDRSVMIDYFTPEGITACRVVNHDRPVFRRIPTRERARAGTAE